VLYSDVQKKIYIQVHIYIPGPKLLQWNFFKSLSYLYEVVRTNFFADLLNFRNFDHHFLEFVAPPTNKNENYVVFLKEQFLLKKRQKPCRNRPTNDNAMLV